MAFDMGGGARHPNATLAALCSLRRRGRLVLMGSMSASLPLSYMDLPTYLIQLYLGREYLNLYLRRSRGINLLQRILYSGSMKSSNTNY